MRLPVYSAFVQLFMNTPSNLCIKVKSLNWPKVAKTVQE